MICPLCGRQTAPGDTLCTSCGGDLTTSSLQASPPPLPLPGQPVPVSPEMPPPPPPPATPAGAAVPPPPPLPTAAAPQAPAPPPFPTQPTPPVRKAGLSTSAIVGIVIAALLGVAILGTASFFALWFLTPREATTTRAAPVDVAPSPEAQAEPTVVATEPASSVAPPAATPQHGEYVVVTEAEARDVVTRFIELRSEKDIEGSKALCTVKMLRGPDGDFVNDQYWNPDSFRIVKVTPDQMYMHVASMGVWPSGEEPTIFSVYREPETGKVLIDGFIDPETSPDLYR